MKYCLIGRSHKVTLLINLYTSILIQIFTGKVRSLNLSLENLNFFIVIIMGFTAVTKIIDNNLI